MSKEQNSDKSSNQPKVTAFRKVLRVIRSCRTTQQLRTAWRFWDRYVALYGTNATERARMVGRLVEAEYETSQGWRLNNPGKNQATHTPLNIPEKPRTAPG